MTASRSPALVGQRFQLAVGEHIVGRDPGAAIPLTADRGLGRRHATLHVTEDMIVVSDNGTTNGTFLNGKKLTARGLARVGARLRFGSWAVLLVESRERG